MCTRTQRLGMCADTLRNELRESGKRLGVSFLEFDVLRETCLRMKLLKVAADLRVLNIDADQNRHDRFKRLAGDSSAQSFFDFLRGQFRSVVHPVSDDEKDGVGGEIARRKFLAVVDG